MVMKKLASASKKTPKEGGSVKRRTKASKRILARAEGSQCFWVNDGQVIADLVELANVLSLMEPHTFTHHVDGNRNDFADWIEFVLGDTELAHSLRGVMKASQTRTLVVKRLKIYDIA
jgi:hypothetical protein